MPSVAAHASDDASIHRTESPCPPPAPQSEVRHRDLAVRQERPIIDIAKEKLGIAPENLEPYGHYKAKVWMDYIKSLENQPNGKLILVSAISPTPAGEGKTTTTVGLTDALNHIGKKAMLCLREPSLGTVLRHEGRRGGRRLRAGRADGGHQPPLHRRLPRHHLGAQPACALIDNHIYWGNALGIDGRRVAFRRVIDMNDRSLRQIVSSLGGVANGFPREDGFDITVASEVMAIFCLAKDLNDLKKRLCNIIVGLYPRPEAGARRRPQSARRHEVAGTHQLAVAGIGHDDAGEALLEESSRSLARQKIAITSEAGVMSKPSSAWKPIGNAARDETIKRKIARSFMSSTRGRSDTKMIDAERITQ